MRSKLVRFTTLLSTLVLPVAASAATITVAPLGHSVPVISTPLLGALALMMAAAGIWVLRRTSAASMAALVVTAVATALVATSYATGGSVVVTGANCLKKTTFNYTSEAILASECTAPVVILEIDACDNDNDTVTYNSVGNCALGLILQQNQSCDLPQCSG